jgi:hypothetical protein
MLAVNELNVPLRTWFARRRVKPGYCLAHVCRLMALCYDHDPNPYVVCMGPNHRLALHCWLEAGDVVVDLTKPERFFDRADYYQWTKIRVKEVRRYTSEEAAKLMVRHGVTFWDFDLSRYVTLPLEQTRRVWRDSPGCRTRNEPQ